MHLFLVAPKLTFIYAGLLGLIYFALSMNVVRYRWKEKQGLGHAADPKSGLFKRIRIHANFMEYIPFLLLLLAFDEMTGQSPTAVHAVGAGLVLGRLGHFLGLRKTDGASVGRFLGTFVTFGALIYLSANLLYKGLA